MGYQQMLLTKDLLTTLPGYEPLDIAGKRLITVNQLGQNSGGRQGLLINLKIRFFDFSALLF